MIVIPAGTDHAYPVAFATAEVENVAVPAIPGKQAVAVPLTGAGADNAMVLSSVNPSQSSSIPLQNSTAPG